MNQQTRNCRNTFRKGPEIIMAYQVKLKLHGFFLVFLLYATSYNLHSFLFLQVLRLIQDTSVFESSGLTLNPTLVI